MKKKGPRAIPDFSSKRNARPDPALPQAKLSPTVPPPDRVPIPTVKTPKGGRRGG